MDASALTRSQFSNRAFALVLSPFAFFGAVFGVWLTLLADLQRVLALSPGALGAAFTGGLALALPGMVLAGRLADRWGARTVIAGAALLIGGAFVGAGLVASYPALYLVFLLFYAATGAFDVGINAAALVFEGRSGRRVMGYCHAAFSAAAALGALTVGALLASGVPFRALYLGMAGVALASGIFWRGAFPHASAPREAAAQAPAGPRLLRVPALLLLAATVALAFLAEGELGNWAAIYLRATLELPVLVGALGFAVFHGAMFVGRLAGARAVLAFGRKRVLVGAGGAVLVGMLLALGTTQALFILLGFLLVGLALSVVAPTTYSLAGDLAPEHAGEASGVLTTVGYSGYLVGPVLVGGLAELTGLRLALLTVAAAGGGIALLSLRVRERADPVGVPGAVEAVEIG